MVHIKITKGLDIPLNGKPKGIPSILLPRSEEGSFPPHPQQIALDLTPFEELTFKLLVRLDDRVKRGQPLLEDKGCPGRLFVSPAGGVVREIRRGLKRRLLSIIIEVGEEEDIQRLPPLDPHHISSQELIEHLKSGGLFTHIRQRPFNVLANPGKLPRSIFVKGIESAPFRPPAEWQVEKYEKEFHVGLAALTKLTQGTVHLVYRQGSTCKAFLDAKNVQKHTAEGPHPIANVSLHIAQIDPIRSAEDVIWTVTAHAVVRIGHFLLYGDYFVPRIVSIAGSGILERQRGYFKIREGWPISSLAAGRVCEGPIRLISGDPLTGHAVEAEDVVGYEDTVFCALPEKVDREFLHFFRLGRWKYSLSRAYLSGHVSHSDEEYDFTTSLRGEHRPFIDSSLLDQVMPLNIPTMHLVKAILADDYDLATELGLLEVDSEDFALPTFVCPSKVEMVEIIKRGLQRYAADVLR